MERLFIATMLVGGFLISNSAQAYWISEHGSLTMVAIESLNHCGKLPKYFDGESQDQLLQGNRSEDTNLIRKWTRYSHYYNPNDRIDMRRQDSSTTIMETVTEVENLLKGQTKKDWNRQQVYSKLGRIIHHLQDASVPSHVTPVNHWGNDGFEVLTVDRQLDLIDCRQLVLPMDMISHLRQTALETVLAMNGRFTFGTSHGQSSSPWIGNFWSFGAQVAEWQDHSFEQPGRMLVMGAEWLSQQLQAVSFGSYGGFGNKFGEVNLTANNVAVTIDSNVYQQFKYQQLERAALATAQTILWFDRKF